VASLFSMVTMSINGYPAPSSANAGPQSLPRPHPHAHGHGHGQANQSAAFNKSVEKTLVEAQQTGHLAMSARSLREFPACAQFDLSDTVTAGKQRWDALKQRF
jgi:hypothetical protein